MNRIAYQLSEAAEIAGVSRTRIFEAARRQELIVRKAGRASIVTHDDRLDRLTASEGQACGWGFFSRRHDRITLTVRKKSGRWQATGLTERLEIRTWNT